MARSKSLLSQIQRTSYLLSRSAGDAKAAERGPGAYVKRRVRRTVSRNVFRLFR